MKFMADENFPRQAVVLLREAGLDVSWISEEASGASDDHVLALCSANERVLLTFDKDFGELAFHQKQRAQCGVVLFRVRSKNPDEVAAIARATLLASREWRGHFSVITRFGVRMRPLATET
jgi:predicted nuclease of predicted toxin-antitoxin system